MRRNRRTTRRGWYPERLEPRMLLAADVLISEFSASNDAVLRDADREYPDWIELHNAGDEAADLTGWYLSDNQENLAKWSFPSGTIPPGGFLVVFASGKDQEDADGSLHTNFQLARSGEYLGLIRPDATTVVTEFAPVYPEQLTDVSYGVRMDDADLISPSEYGYFASPTPGARNASEFALGPIVSQVSHAPQEPLVTESITVAANVAKTLAEVASVQMSYRVMYADEVQVIMTDDGQGADNVAGDGVFSAEIPANIAEPGQMIRYYIVATDVDGNEMRAPRITDTRGTDRSPEYFGTITQDPTLVTSLPVFHWFAERTSRARSRSGSRVSVYYAGEFYDNVFARQRGGATNGRSQKFNFNDDQPFYVNETLGRVAEINLNAQGSDPTFVRQPMAFQTYTLAGNESSESFFMLMRDNATPDRVGIFIEQVNEDFLTRQNLDPQGALYKFVQRSNLNPVFADTVTGIEKKTRLDEGLDDLRQVVDGLTMPTQEERGISVFDNFNVAQLLNYLAVRSITMDADDVRKNFYLYRDTNGTSQWSIFPWDKDWTFGIVGDGGQFLEHPFFGDQAHRKDNALQWNRLYDAVFNDPVLSQMYLRRLRTVMDEILQPPGTEDGILEQLADRIAASAEGEISGNIAAIKSFLRQRRDTLFNEHVVDPAANDPITDIIPEFSPAEYFVPIDNSLGLSWTGIEDPANVAQWQKGETGLGFNDRFDALIRTRVVPRESCDQCTSIFVRIPFDLDDVASVKKLTLQMKYDDGFIAYLNGQEVARTGVRGDVSFDMRSFGHRNSAAMEFENFNVSNYVSLLKPGRNVLAIHAVNSSPISDDQLILPKLIDGVIANDAAAGIPLAQLGNPKIVFGVVEHNPSSNQDEEFIELRNENDTAVDISRWRIQGGVDHRFPAGTVIPAGRSLYVSPSVPAFLARTDGPTGGQGLFVQGNYQGHLSNFGETIALVAANGQMMDTFATPVTPSDVQRYLRISEVHYHPAGASEATEFIELVNTSTAEPLDLSGVQLSRGPAVPLAIADGTLLPPGEHLLIAKDRDALLAAYPTLAAERVLGDYTGSLSNGGERIKVDDATGSTVEEFVYDDQLPWPVAADGAGSSLHRVGFSGDPSDPSQWVAAAPSPGVSDRINADLDGDGQVTTGDIDFACDAVNQNAASMDLNQDGSVDVDDVMFYVQRVLGTSAGDANLDGVFNSADLLFVFQAGAFENGVDGDSHWAEGDWNCDGDFSTGDLLVAFQSGRYLATAQLARQSGRSLIGASLSPDPVHGKAAPQGQGTEQASSQLSARQSLEVPLLDSPSVQRPTDEESMAVAEIDGAFRSLDQADGVADLTDWLTPYLP